MALSTLLLIIAATLLVSIISVIGIITLILKKKLLDEILLILVSLSAGALMGGAFLHLIPEALEKFADFNLFVYVLIGFALFFFIEKVLYWRHCHKGKCPVHTFAYMNLLGDGVHNFIDGLIIAASFIVAIPLGLVTTLAVALHEIPQEIGDFGVLVYGGFDKFKALSLNFITALTAIVGGIVGYFLSTYIEASTAFLIPFAAGGFIYIAASDLVPEIRKEMKFEKYITSFIVFVIGILVMYAVKIIAF